MGMAAPVAAIGMPLGAPMGIPFGAIMGMGDTGPGFVGPTTPGFGGCGIVAGSAAIALVATPVMLTLPGLHEVTHGALSATHFTSFIEGSNSKSVDFAGRSADGGRRSAKPGHIAVQGESPQVGRRPVYGDGGGRASYCRREHRQRGTMTHNQPPSTPTPDQHAPQGDGPTQQPDPDNDGGSGMMIVWVIAAVALMVFIGGFAVLLFNADSENSSSGTSAVTVGRPIGKPHGDGLIVEATDDTVTMNLIVGGPTEFVITDTHRPNIDIEHARFHAATGQMTRTYYEQDGDELILLYFDDAVVQDEQGADVPFIEGVIEGSPQKDGFTLVSSDGTTHVFRMNDDDQRMVRVEHLEQHEEADQPARIFYREDDSGKWAIGIQDLVPGEE